MTRTQELLDIRKSPFWDVFVEACARCNSLERFDLLEKWLNADSQLKTIAAHMNGRISVKAKMGELKARLIVESVEPQNTAETVLRSLLIKIGYGYDSIESTNIEYFGEVNGQPKYPTDKLTPHQIDSIARHLLCDWAFKGYLKNTVWSEKLIRRYEKGELVSWGDIVDRFIASVLE